MKGLDYTKFQSKGNSTNDIEIKKEDEIEKIVKDVATNSDEKQIDDNLEKYHREAVNKKKKLNNEIIAPFGFPAKSLHLLKKRDVLPAANLSLEQEVLRKVKQVATNSEVTMKDLVANILEDFLNKFDKDYFR